MMRSLSYLSVAALATTCRSARVSSPSTECTRFANSLDLTQYNTTVLNSTYFAKHAYEVAGVSNNVAFCQIYATVAYGHRGDGMVFTIWLPPASHYQGRFLSVGDGGFAGVIETNSMLADLNLDLGFAVAGGDGGHSAANNDAGNGAPGVYLPFLHDPAQVEGWIHDGISLFTPAAKAITEAHYGRIRYSYYDGCSTGGAQGFALAQFHPTMYDGIVASSPGNYYSHLALSFLWNFLAANSTVSYIPQNKLTAMTNAVVAVCDGEDGVEDGVIANPPLCKFDVDSFACSATNPSLNATDCLTAAQLITAKAIYAGPKRRDNGAQIYPGFAFGSESSWVYQETVLADAFSIPILQNLVYDNLNYNADTFNFASDVDTVDEKAGTYIDEISPDLQAFHSSGGKLLTVQGWADQLNSPYWPIEHLRQVEEVFGGPVNSWFELFMAAGAGHCGANPLFPNAPGTYATTAAMVDWVEKGHTPEQIEASQPSSGANVTRKLCPYPQYAKYMSGNVNDWTSFACDYGQWTV